MKYYAANNSYGSETSVGFANTWGVKVFASKKDRDEFVRNGDLSARAIKKTEIGRYLGAVKPFSGKAYMIQGDSVVIDFGDQGQRLYS